MIEIETPADLAILLDAFDQRGGVLEFAFYDPSPQDCCDESHREAARQFLDARATAAREFVESIDDESPFSRMLDYKWDIAKLRGNQISFGEFWGNDDVERKQMTDTSWSIPNVDGYKTAFFHPSHGLNGGVAGNGSLFCMINNHVLGGADRSKLTIWSWSTDCSSHFDDGHEWWGAFLWTLSRKDSDWIVLIGASATD